MSSPDIQVNLGDNYGFTPIHIASFKGNLAIVNALLSSPGTQVHAKSNNGWTPLHTASEYSHLSCVSVLENKNS
ncbi:ankyrin repeat domain-containing protein [Cardinium endosymbiont of Nabis limbatus]|uniref:ankyrin repeat domain-containing protein n=1 Tax=Cardinium endosymbiont of Nabis limbatus TaxID=3066217 RepID=UPI003AF3E275